MPDKEFMSPRRGGTIRELANTARVATTDAVSNAAGAGRGDPKSYANQIVNQAGAGLITPQFVTPTNPLVHNTNNIVTNSTDSSTTDGKIDLNKAFIPNILDNYDVVTYHWKFFIVTNEAASSGEIFNPESQTIIAESGVSDLTIDKVEIRSVTTPSVESGTGTSTVVKFEIVEPAGAGLIDKIFYQSLALGIGNWNVMPFYLQLQFRGRSPETSEAEDGSPGSIGTLRWIYPIKITSIKANVTTVGTRYEFDAIIYNEYAQSNTTFSLQHPVVLNDLSTFPDAMAKLQYQLNNDQFYKLIDNNSIPDSYKIVVDPIFASSEYNITPVNSNTNTVRNNSMNSLEGKNASFPAFTSIDKIIDSLLAQTNGYQKSMLNAKTPGADGDPMNAEVSQMKKFWRIITESRPLKFDPSRTDYAREYTIFVVQYDIGILDQTSFQDTAPPLTLEAERKRLMTYVKKSILKKKYNYIFTGLNDQIINFDIKINNAFAVAQARMGGIYFNSAMADKGVVTHDHSAEEAAVSSKIHQAISFQNNADVAKTEEAQIATVDAQNAIKNSSQTPDEKERLLNLLNHSKPESRLNYNTSVQNAATSGISDTFNLAKINAKDRATPRNEKITQENLNFISDVDIKSPAAAKAYSNYVKGIKGKIRPVARVDSMQQRQVGLGLESNSNSGLQKLSSMFSVALHSSYDTSFAQTQLTIKGDPFWLFPQPFTDVKARIYNSLKPENEAINFIKNAHFQMTDSVNIFGTDNFILIRFRTPRVFDADANPDTDNANDDVETFSGVFKVVSVVNKFDNGKFHQDLTCIMDYNINILNFMEEIENNAKQSDIPASPETLMQKTQLPLSSISTQRIQGALDIKGVENTLVTALSPAQQTLKNVVSFKGPSLGSNIPSSLPNLIPGLPNIFG
jgi:hypothetical protein